MSADAHASGAESRFLAALFDGAPSRVPLGPGDDAAQLPGGLLAALDTVVEGVHFELGADRRAVAEKALAACESDLCAMGAVGRWVLLSAQLPPGEDLAALAAALRAAAARWELEIVGGDTVRSAPDTLALAVTILGPPPEGPIWRRSGGRPGDRLFVSGPLGGSRGARHLRPRARRDLVKSLRTQEIPVHAAMDLSDGLGADLPRLCAASGCGARIRAETLPIHPDVPPEADDVTAALGDGEDFELLLALAPEALEAHAAIALGLVELGVLTSAAELILERGGRAEPWPVAGYEHEF